VTEEISSTGKHSGRIQVEWVRSGIGFTYKQRQIVRSLGLRRLRQVVNLPDTAAVRGSVASVAHLVQIVQPAAQPAWASIPEYSIRAPEVSSKEPAAPSVADGRVGATLPSLGMSDTPLSEPLPETDDSGEISAASGDQE
jgi:large subunit ribosomal protein L30